MSEQPTTGTARHWRLGRHEIAGILVFWTFVGLLSAFNRAIDPRMGGLQLFPLGRPVALALAEAAVWALVTPLIFWFASRYPLERNNWIPRLFLYFAAALAVALAADEVIAFIRTSVLEIPMRGPRGRGAFRFGRRWLINDLVVALAVFSAGIARELFLRDRDRQQETIQLQAEAARLEAQLSQARLSALRMQLNPHFLFNTLHAISALVERDPAGVRKMIARLSELLRSSLEHSHQQEVTLDEEVRFTERYLDIMRIRFQGRLETSVDAPAEVMSARVPSLVLQPLIENAFKHGVSRGEGVGRVSILARRDGRMLVLQVRDNGPGIESEEAEAGMGLANTRDRLAQLYGAEGELRLASDGPETVASIRLPFRTTTGPKGTA